MEIRLDGWYRCDIDGRRLVQLVRRSDRCGLVQFISWMGLTLGTGYLAWLFLGSVWMIPAFFLYGTIYAFCEAANHELIHGTVFRRRWLNEAALWITCFMTSSEPVFRRYHHFKHHRTTSILGEDPEGAGNPALSSPPKLWVIASEMVCRMRHLRKHFTSMLHHSVGVISNFDRDCIQIPLTEYRKMKWNSRALLLLHAAIVAWSIAAQTWLPIVFLFLPRLYGTWLHDILARTQHDGLAVNVKDHRLTTRTVILNPVLRYLYWNMNFHVEHHMYPSVPFFSLPKLHQAIKHQLPQPSIGVWGAWREILPTYLRQKREPDYHLTPRLP